MWDYFAIWIIFFVVLVVILTHLGVSTLNIMEQIVPLLHISIDVRKLDAIFGLDWHFRGLTLLVGATFLTGASKVNWIQSIHRHFLKCQYTMQHLAVRIFDISKQESKESIFTEVSLREYVCVYFMKDFIKELRLYPVKAGCQGEFTAYYCLMPWSFTLSKPQLYLQLITVNLVCQIDCVSCHL